MGLDRQAWSSTKLKATNRLGVSDEEELDERKQTGEETCYLRSTGEG